jgi:hypothetical protein
VFATSAEIVSFSCDLGMGPCDLYVILTVKTASNRTPTVWNNNTPVWNAFLLAASDSDLLSSFHPVLWDENAGILPDQLIGGTGVTALTQSQLNAGKAVVEFTVQPKPPAPPKLAARVTFSIQKI